MQQGADKAIEEMMKADQIRSAFLSGKKKNFYLVDQPWTMLEEPWRIQWIDKRSGKLCEVTPIGVPYGGERYSMFVIYSQEEDVVKNYVFLTDNYHFSGDIDDASTDN